jgi:GxxExxY protein
LGDHKWGLGLVSEILYRDEAYKIIGCAMKVHAELGCGFLEPVYQEALEIMFQMEDVPYRREPVLKVEFMGQTLRKEYSPDFICYDKIIVELKAQDQLVGVNRAQTISYLCAAKMKLGLLINFGAEHLQHERLVRHFNSFNSVN